MPVSTFTCTDAVVSSARAAVPKARAVSRSNTATVRSSPTASRACQPGV